MALVCLNPLPGFEEAYSSIATLLTLTVYRSVVELPATLLVVGNTAVNILPVLLTRLVEPWSLEPHFGSAPFEPSR